RPSIGPSYDNPALGECRKRGAQGHQERHTALSKEPLTRQNHACTSTGDCIDKLVYRAKKKSTQPRPRRHSHGHESVCPQRTGIQLNTRSHLRGLVEEKERTSNTPQTPTRMGSVPPPHGPPRLKVEV
uniref:Uncharacterized protein n=1 Tax=Mustela putorius furo TaxID=9669 RepID=M3Y4S8_MUSPF